MWACRLPGIINETDNRKTSLHAHPYTNVQQIILLFLQMTVCPVKTIMLFNFNINTSKFIFTNFNNIPVKRVL